jgi:hypothetical protein
MVNITFYSKLQDGYAVCSISCEKQRYEHVKGCGGLILVAKLSDTRNIKSNDMWFAETQWTTIPHDALTGTVELYTNQECTEEYIF